MKQGRTPTDLAQEILRQKEAKTDFAGNTSQLTMVPLEGDLRLAINGHDDYPINTLAHRQIGERLGIPAKYYDVMLAKAPELLAANVNHWFQATPSNRMVRTLDGKVRAFLSDKYRPLDNYDLVEAVLPVISDAGASLESCEITEDRLYLKGVVRGIQETVPPPDNLVGQHNAQPVPVSPGIVISNSEVGTGALSIQPAVHFLACTNMAVWAQHALRKYHSGKALVEAETDIWNFLSNDTRELTEAALWAQVRDLAKGALKGDIFQTILNDLHEARSQPIENIVGTIERIADSKSLHEEEQQGILKYLVQGGDLTKFGMSNAITRYSQDSESYERASFLEQLGGEIIVLPQNDWARYSRN